MDGGPDVRQVLTIAGPNVESITSSADAVELARMANDELAEAGGQAPGPLRDGPARACR